IDDIIAEKDEEIEKLKKELETAKRGTTQVSYSALVKKIDTLQKSLDLKESELADKKKILDDLQKTSSASDLQTKLIVLQSKIRQKDIKIRDLTEDVNKKDKKIAALEKITETEGGGVSIEELKSQNVDLEGQVQGLRQQLMALGEKAAEAANLQQENESLQAQLATAQASPASAGPIGGRGVDPAQIAALQGEIRARDEQIASLQQQLTGAQVSGTGSAAGPNPGTQVSGTSFMSARRAEMRVRELESQVEMLKKSEAQMRQQFQEAQRKLSDMKEFNW
ncbi:MAG TPA: hypothetical protein VKK79_07295, partial [Candidatus Lokiarchaeia archaeon]|nr:hypothetical protein [Candidatus Lokiarchaeia archaeon]